MNSDFITPQLRNFSPVKSSDERRGASSQGIVSGEGRGSVCFLTLTIPPHVPIWHLSIVYSHTQHCIDAQVLFSTNQPFISVTVLATEKIPKLNFTSVIISLLTKCLLLPPAKVFSRYFRYFPAPSLLAQFGKTHFFRHPLESHTIRTDKHTKTDTHRVWSFIKQPPYTHT